jgi:hypothetical protein
VVYSSPDLQTWTLEGNLLKSPPNGVFYRPYVVFNPRTQKYVLWYNWYPKLWEGQDGVAVSDNPAGPFVIVNPKAHIVGTRPGDGSLFVDDDSAGYYIYTDIADNYTVRVERLTPDFLDSSGKTSNIIAHGAEAPLLFRRNQYYYVLCGPLCAACPEGSEVQVFASQSPLGPFFTNPSLKINSAQPGTSGPEIKATAVNRPSGAFGTTNSSLAASTGVPRIAAQETWVAKIPNADSPIYIWMGDRWQSNPDGLIAHDFQYWVPLDFAADGEILPLKEIPRWGFVWKFD